jgi:protease-4
MRVIGRIILWFFAVIGLLSVAVTVLIVIGITHLKGRVEAMGAGTAGRTTVADDTVLTLDLERPVSERTPQAFAAIFNQDTLNFPTLLASLKRATTDSRIKGIVVRTGEPQLGLAQAEELRDAIIQFRAVGKFAYAYADSFGEISGGTRGYYLASAFDEIWLQPSGSLALTGVSANIPFFKGTLDKLGVTAQFERRGEYKTAATQFTDAKLPDSDRQAMQEMVGSIYDQIAQQIGDARHLGPSDVKALIDGGPYSGDDALAKHLIDRQGYLDEIESAAQKKAGGGELMGIVAYGRAPDAPAASSGPSIAVIRAIGEIHGGRTDDSPFSNDSAVGADTMVNAFLDAAKDDDVKAIVLRIDSPGGSATASETIWRGIKRAQEMGKPVIVSMGDTAASGGYYIAAPADKIVAEPTTLTGSIGVFSGKFVMSGLYDKLGLSWDTVSLGKNAEMGSELQPFTPDQQQRFAALIDGTYKGFIAHVADGRHLDPKTVDGIARGRVWTGAQAKDRGLVDALGGFDVAVRLAKEAAHLPVDQPAALKSFPRPRSPFEALFNGLNDSEPPQILTTLKRLAALEPLVQKLAALSPGTEDAEMRPVRIDQ